MGKKRKQGTIWIKHIALIGATLLLLFIIINISLAIITKHNREIVVPEFINYPLDEAQLLAEATHVRIEVVDSVYIKRMERGYISRQNPAPGSWVKKGRRVLLTINSVNPQMTKMPNVVGLSLRQAKTEIIAAGLSVGRLYYEKDIATNNVLAQKIDNVEIEPGYELETDTTIDLVLGMNSNDSTTFVPNVIGYKYSIAKDILNDNSLNIRRILFDETVESYIDSLDAMVYVQIPPYSDSLQYRRGSGVELRLTKDQSKIVVETDDSEEK